MDDDPVLRVDDLEERGGAVGEVVVPFAQQLRPQDYVAMMTFDMRTQIVTDFTQDKRQILESINSLRIPGFSERNLFDALYEAFSAGRLVAESSVPGVDFARLASKIAGVAEQKKKRFSLFG